MTDQQPGMPTSAWVVTGSFHPMFGNGGPVVKATVVEADTPDEAAVTFARRHASVYDLRRGVTMEVRAVQDVASEYRAQYSDPEPAGDSRVTMDYGDLVVSAESRREVYRG